MPTVRKNGKYYKVSRATAEEAVRRYPDGIELVADAPEYIRRTSEQTRDLERQEQERQPAPGEGYKPAETGQGRASTMPDVSPILLAGGSSGRVPRPGQFENTFDKTSGHVRNVMHANPGLFKKIPAGAFAEDPHRGAREKDSDGMNTYAGDALQRLSAGVVDMFGNAVGAVDKITSKASFLLPAFRATTKLGKAQDAIAGKITGEERNTAQRAMQLASDEMKNIVKNIPMICVPGQTDTGRKDFLN